MPFLPIYTPMAMGLGQLEYRASCQKKSAAVPLRKNLIKTHKEIHENNLNSHSFCRDILVRLTAKYHLFDDF
jgi:hypothetical protein